MLAIGSHGDDVKHLQLRLRALNYDVGSVDGLFGPKTQAALKLFQQHYEKLEDTGVLDPETNGQLNQALVILSGPTTPVVPVPAPVPAPVPCDPQIWQAFNDLVKLLTSTVCYGPGRGLFVPDPADPHGGKLVVTYGPGSLHAKAWPTHKPHTYPSFHCTSFVNFFLGWLLRYGPDFTHAGNIPSVFDLLSKSRDLHPQDGSPYRGYGPYCTQIQSDGSTATRAKIGKVADPKDMDIHELYARRAQLPTFIPCGQSTHSTNGWLEWHHVVLFVVDHTKPGHPMFRIAADGRRDAQGYSGNPMRYVEITADTKNYFKDAMYRAYGVNTTDGTYGDPTKPIYQVAIEA